MKILVCGGRNYLDIRTLTSVLDQLSVEYPGFELIQGEARGADLMADFWARSHNVPTKGYPANWKAHGKAAGFLRNQWMLEDGKPDLVVAFPGGNGTADMVRRAKSAGVPVREVGARPE